MSERADLPGRAVDAVEDAVEAVEDDAEALRAASKRSGWFRIEHLFFALVAAFLLIYFLAYFVFDVSFDSMRQWGYLGVFLIAMAGSATIVLPTPSNLAIFG